jgi:threonyl-tRNA synthetase
MIHRAIAGSLERFMSVIIEHFAGAFPAWLAPVQAHILPVNQVHEDFAYNLASQLKDAGGRVEIHDPSDSLGKRIRNSQTGKVPYTLVVGDSEINSGKVNVRAYGSEKEEVMGLDQFIELLNA